jgi:hypothetical protein
MKVKQRPDTALNRVGPLPLGRSEEGGKRSMHPIQEDMAEFGAQLKRGSIQRAYYALLQYMAGLRTHFQKKYPDYALSGLYQGYMDMTYFAILPPSLKRRGLKIAIVFNYEAFRFEAWLAGGNRKVQQQYWELVKNSQWPAYRVVTPAKGVDSIIECNLAEDFDFADLGGLTARIEANTAKFVAHIESFLSEHDGA